MESWCQRSVESYNLELCNFWGISVLVFSIADLCFMFGNFMEYSMFCVPSCFGVANNLHLLTFWNLLETKEENRLPKPKMTFSTPAKQIRSQEQCSSAAFPSDYITSPRCRCASP